MPISLASAKEYLKVDTSADDNFILSVIEAVTIFAERHTGRDLRTNNWFAYADEFETSMELRKRPIEGIDSVSYIYDGNVLTVADTVYELNKNILYACLQLKTGQSWPTLVDVVPDAVRISFNTFADRKTPDVKLCMLKHIAYAYENRGDDERMTGYRAIEFYNSVAIPKY